MGRRYGLLAAGLLAAGLLASCKMDRKGGHELEQRGRMVVVNTNQDDMVYGTLGDAGNGDSLFVNTDSGDSIWIRVADDETLVGDMQTGCRLAIVPADKDLRVAQKVINLTMLMGEWVQPSALAEGTYYGVELQEGGTALSINSQTTEYEGWHLHEGQLLLSSVAVGIDVDEQMIDTFRIMRLTPDSLLLEGADTKFFFCRQSSVKARDELAPYVDEDESRENYDLFNPEGDVPAGDSSDDGLMY